MVGRAHPGASAGSELHADLCRLNRSLTLRDSDIDHDIDGDGINDDIDRDGIEHDLDFDTMTAVEP